MVVIEYADELGRVGGVFFSLVNMLEWQNSTTYSSLYEDKITVEGDACEHAVTQSY